LIKLLRRDIAGVKGAADAGILTISVGKQIIPKNEFYRTPARAGLLVAAMQGQALVAHGSNHPIGNEAVPIEQAVLMFEDCDGWNAGTVEHHDV
jgi:hypothetical protein